MREEPIVLNKEQKRVVNHNEGPLLVIAGAGTGKTRVITERIKRLILEEGIKSEEILALTFTEKSAHEMEERVDMALPLGVFGAWIMTFHSFCEKVLRENSLRLGIDPAYQIIGEAESQLLLKNKLMGLELEYYQPLGNPTKFLGALLRFFNRLRDEDVSPKNLRDFWEGRRKKLKGKSRDSEEVEELGRLGELAGTYEFYQKIKQEKSLLDYADLIFFCLELFRTQPAVLRKYQQQFRHILVDEYQDTNYVQTQLLHLLAGREKNVMVVCDDDQSIYRWRGAAIYNVMDFEKHYPKMTIVSLVKNYRSAQVILDHAYTLIQNNNPTRLEVKLGVDKKLKAARSLKGQITFINPETAEGEVEAVSKEIQRLVGVDKYSYGDIAVLVRANNHADQFARSFARKGIPCVSAGPGKFFNKEVVKDLLAYLRFLVDITDNPSLYRVLTMPHFSLNGRDLAMIVAYARRENITLFESLEKIKQTQSIGRETVEIVEGLLKMVYGHLARSRDTAGQLLYSFLEETDILASLGREGEAESFERAITVGELFEHLSRFELGSESASVRDFLAYVDLSLSARGTLASDDLVPENVVRLLTIHSAKGLEFPVVFMVNLVTSRFPSMNRRDPIPLPEKLIKEKAPDVDTHLQEERRLFYVGMTRAEERLYFTAAQTYGLSGRLRKLSPFIKESLGENIEKFKKEYVEERTLFDYSFINDQKNTKSTQSVQRKRKEYVSYSQLNTYDVCPLQYKYRYVVKLPTIRSAAASYGTTLHTTLRDFYNGLKAGNKWGLDDLLDLYKSHWSSVGYTDKKFEERRKREGEVALREYFDRYHDCSKLPTHIEQPFRINMGKVVLKGIVDRVDPLPKGKIEIIDYKTSKPLDEKKLAKDSQLTFYALAASSPQFLNVPVEKMVLSIYNFSDHIKRSTTRSMEDIAEAEKYIKKTVTKIQESDFKPKVSMLCKFCSFQMLCDEYQGSMGI